jgi:hypothetical protein
MLAFVIVSTVVPVLFNVDIAFLAAVLPKNWYAYVAVMSIGFDGLVAVAVAYGVVRVRTLYKNGRI